MEKVSSWRLAVGGAVEHIIIIIAFDSTIRCTWMYIIFKNNETA